MKNWDCRQVWIGFVAGVGFVTLVALFARPVPPAVAAGDSCIECHSQLDERYLSDPVKDSEQGIHTKRGLSCAGCHGGDPSDPEFSAMDEDKGFRGVPEKEEIAEMCARCHADAAFMKRYDPTPYIFSMHEFRTSVHCKRTGVDPKVATCTNCHGVHGILPHSDPSSPVHATNVPETCSNCHNSEYMKGRTVPTDQFELYKNSVHGHALLEKGDLSAPACNDCHGNHGAAPPGYENITLVCGSCHGREAELFGDSKMWAAMDEMDMPGCVACHDNHDVQHPTDDFLSTGESGKCGDCHEEGSHAEAATDSIITRFRSLLTQMANAESLLALAEFKGMDTERARAYLREAHDVEIAGRVEVHSFDAEQITGTFSEGITLATMASDGAESALRDWRVRRIGLAAALVVIAILIAALIGKIRAMESKGVAPQEEPGSTR